MSNYAFTTRRALPRPKCGQRIEFSNFHRSTPHTKIFEGVSGLVFFRCNLLNCDPPADAELIESNNSQVSHCSHLHPEWVAKGLRKCPEDCEHVVDTEEVWEDGVLVERFYQYKDKAV